MPLSYVLCAVNRARGCKRGVEDRHDERDANERAPGRTAAGRDRMRLPQRADRHRVPGLDGVPRKLLAMTGRLTHKKRLV